MVSADPRRSSLTADFRVSSVRDWAASQAPLPPYPIVRGGPAVPSAPVVPAGLMLDQAGSAITDQAGGALA